MLEYLRRRQEDEKGFTLIELMVVVLIIAILIAIAIPTFLGAQDRARDRAAQSDLRNTLTAAKSIGSDFEGNWQTEDTCTDATASDDLVSGLNEENASLDYAAGVTTSEDSVAVEVTSSCEELLLQRLSTSGTNFCLAGHQDGNTFRGKDEDGTAFADYAACETAAEDW